MTTNTRDRQITTWGGQVGIRLEPDMAERLDRFCKATHRSRAQAARMALELFLLAEAAPHE